MIPRSLFKKKSTNQYTKKEKTRLGKLLDQLVCFFIAPYIFCTTEAGLFTVLLTKSILITSS